MITTSNRLRTMYANDLETGITISNFYELDGTNSLFCRMKTNYEFRNPDDTTDIWNCSNVKVKLLHKPNGYVPTSTDLEPFNLALDRVLTSTAMNPNQRYKKLITLQQGCAKAVAFLVDGTSYIVTVAVVNRGSHRHLIVFVDDEYPGKACWGSKAKDALDFAGDRVGGNFDMLFHDY